MLPIGSRIDEPITCHLGGGFSTILVTACVRCYAVLNNVIYKVRINEMDETQPKIQYWSFTILFPLPSFDNDFSNLTRHQLELVRWSFLLLNRF